MANPRPPGAAPVPQNISLLALAEINDRLQADLTAVRAQLEQVTRERDEAVRFLGGRVADEFERADKAEAALSALRSALSAQQEEVDTWKRRAEAIAGNVALSVEAELQVLRDDREKSAADLTAVRAQLAEAREVLHSPEKWQQWCDIRMLERCEAAEAALTALRAELKDLREDFSAMEISYETAREETLQAERELVEVRARLALPPPSHE